MRCCDVADLPWQAKSVSYAAADEGVLRLEEEDEMGCFFDSCNSWGIQRRQTIIFCKACGAKLGVVLEDGPAENGSRGQMGFGPSQMLARVKRYRFWDKSIVFSPPEQDQKS